MKQFLDKIFSWVSNLIGVDKKIAMGIVIGVVALVLILIVTIIVVVCKKKKAKREKVAVVESQNQSSADKKEDINENIKSESNETVREVKDEVAEPTVTEDIVKKEKTKKVVAKLKSKGTTKKVEEKSVKKLNGKWVIEEKKNDEYIAVLVASNGEIMLTGESYTTADGAKNGVATIVKGVENGKFIVYNAKNGGYFYKLKSAGNKLLCVGEVYNSKDGCQKAIESVKRFAKTAVMVNEVVTSHEYVEYTPQKVEYEIKKGARGKWKIEKTDEGKFSAKLYANNGQLMLATEEVSQLSTAKNAIDLVKKNCADGNFVIDKDKFGQFYYKLRNSKRTVICVGESYNTLEGCINALESVRKFAAISELSDN